MPPPPNTARAIRAFRPVTLDTLRDQVLRDVDHVASAKAQNVRQMQNYINIDQQAQHARKHITEARAIRQGALDALEAGDPAAVARLLRMLGPQFDQAMACVEMVHELVATGHAIEAEDVHRERQRGDETGIRLNQVRQLRRDQGPTGPGVA